MLKDLQAIFTFVKTTRGTVVYANQAVGMTIYVPKRHFDPTVGDKYPTTLRVEVREA